MTYTIAVAGKGGTGKTTLAALIVYHLLKNNKGPVLAVDADPNSNLSELLGVEFDRTVVSTVDELMEKKEELSPSITKEAYLQYNLEEAIVESSGFDLLVMGRTEGPGCYCYANLLLRNFMEKLRENYRFVVMDNEAGMEHLSRRTTRDVDALLIVSTPTPVALRSAKRIYQTAQSLKLNIGKIHLVINQLGSNSTPGEEIKAVGLPLLSTIPYDQEVMNSSAKAKSLLDLLPDSAAVKEVQKLAEQLKLLC
jgi:CO dehydrogenase maturation factor